VVNWGNLGCLERPPDAAWAFFVAFQPRAAIVHRIETIRLKGFNLETKVT